MPQNPPEGYPRVSPYLYYEDGAAALNFLTSAFGFTERMRLPDEQGRIRHAEVELDGGVVMLGEPGAEHKSPNTLGGKTQSVFVYVDDVDAHYAHAKEAGATILSEPEDKPYGDRQYGVEDPEGHGWYFGTHVWDVSPEEYGATTGEPAAVN